MDENKVNVIEQEEKYEKNYMHAVAFIIVLIIGILIGVLLMKFVITYRDNQKVIKDYTVYVNQEEQVFRDKDGKRIYPILENGKIYLPINELGSYLGYMTISNNDELYLYDIKDTGEYIVDGFSTTDYEGNIIDSDIFSKAKYNMFFLWATWCPDCKTQIEEFEKLGSYFKDNDIQVFSLAVDNSDKTKDGLSVEMTKNVGIDYYLYGDRVLTNRLIGNSVWIPKMVVVDDDGRLIKIFEQNLSDTEVKSFFDNILGVER